MELGSFDAQRVMHKNDEVGSSFLFLLKMKKGVRLPPHMKRVASPKYWKYEEKGRGKSLLAVRQEGTPQTSGVANRSRRTSASGSTSLAS